MPSTAEPIRRRAVKPPPGTERPQRLRPKLRYELIGCGLHGHELIGTNAAALRPEDAVFAREDPAGFRWYRCVRCDSWLPLPPPDVPKVEIPPDHDLIELPLRGRALRDRYVLRLIAVDRLLHVLVLGSLAVAIIAFATHRGYLHHEYTRILADLQGGLGGPVASSHSWLVKETNRLFALRPVDLYLAGTALAAYTAILIIEMFGLWWARRWAEYLTLVETSVLVPYEIYELAHGISYLKLITLVLNLAVVLYLLLRHRLFGLRGGVAAENAEREADAGWPALAASTPPVTSTPSGRPLAPPQLANDFPSRSVGVEPTG
jgi:uncharacterized membrane protein (DUF2068 family)